MEKEMNSKTIKALKEFRDVMYNSLTEEEKKRVDEKEVKLGAKRISEMISDMHPVSRYCILKSVLNNCPRIVTDIANFSTFIDRSFDVFGAEKTARMFSGAIQEIAETLKEESSVSEKLKEMNGEPDKETEKEDEYDMPEEIKELLEFLNSKGWELEIKKLTEDEDD